MFKENFKMVGNIQLLLIDTNGQTKLQKTIPNLVVMTGKEYVAQRMVSNNAMFMSHIAIGSGTSNTHISNIVLGTELARAEMTSANSSSNTVTYVAPFLPGVGVGAITEAGIFNSATANSGTMLCRTTFPVVNKEAGDTLTITWNVSPS